MFEQISRYMNKIFDGGKDYGIDKYDVVNPLDAWISIPRASELLPYESYDELSQLFFNKGATGFVLLCDPSPGASLKEQNRIAEFFKHEKNLPDGASLQFLLFASPKIKDFLDHWQLRKEGEVHKDLAKKRVEFLAKKAFRGKDGHLARDFKLLVSYSVPDVKMEDLTKVEELKEIRQGLIATLNGVGVYAEVMGASELIKEVGSILNMNNEIYYEPQKWNKYESLNRQIIDPNTSYQSFEDFCTIENNSRVISKTYVPKSSPDYWALSHMDKFIGDLFNPKITIPCPYLIHYGITAESSQDLKKTTMLGKREASENNINSNLAKFMPSLYEQAEEEAEAAKQLLCGERFVNAGISVTLLANKEMIKSAENSLEYIWSSTGWRFEEAKGDHFAMLIASMPMMWSLGVDYKIGINRKAYYGCGTALKSLGRVKRTITKECQNMLPIIADFKGEMTPGIPLLERRGQVSYWNVFGHKLYPGHYPEEKLSYNCVITGDMGTGKSFLCNEQICNVLAAGGSVVSIEAGNSFYGTCKILGGEHVKYDLTNPVSINPFTNIPIGSSEDDMFNRQQGIVILSEILVAICFPEMDYDKTDKALLLGAVNEVWARKKNKGEINDVHQYLVNYGTEHATNLSHRLERFSRDKDKGMYSDLFNPPASLDINNKFMVFEVGGLEKSIIPSVVQMMMTISDQKMSGSDRQKPFLILIDECKTLLSACSPGFVDAFCDKIARNARKYCTSLTLASQLMTDFSENVNPGLATAFKTAASKVILAQSEDTLSGLKGDSNLSTFVDNEYKYNLFRSLEKVKGRSEMCIVDGDGGMTVARLWGDPYTALLYSSDSDDYVAKKKYLDLGYSIKETLENILRERSGQSILPLANNNNDRVA